MVQNILGDSSAASPLIARKDKEGKGGDEVGPRGLGAGEDDPRLFSLSDHSKRAREDKTSMSLRTSPGGQRGE